MVSFSSLSRNQKKNKTEYIFFIGLTKKLVLGIPVLVNVLWPMLNLLTTSLRPPASKNNMLICLFADQKNGGKVFCLPLTLRKVAQTYNKNKKKQRENMAFN